jgi:rhamnose transport system permease protein
MSESAARVLRRSNGPRGWVKLGPERLRELSLVAIIALAILIFSQLVDNYLSGNFFNRVTTSVAIVAVLAAAQTLVILTRNIDLSVGSIVGVTAYVTGEYLGNHPNTEPVLAVGLAMAIGCGLGLLNGALVAYARVPSIIVTLGTLAIYRTWLIGHAEARTITADSLPDWLVDLPQATLVSIGDLDIRVVFAVAVLVVVALQVALGRLRWGRWLYAAGSNPNAARQAGLPVQRVTLSAFAMCGALAGLAGFLFLSRFGTITVTAGQGLELQSVAAAVVGGVNIFGGSGTLVGALLGGLLVGTLDQSLVRVPQVSEFWRDAVLGALILLAVAVDFAVGKRLRGLMASESRRRLSAGVPPEQKATTDA